MRFVILRILTHSELGMFHEYRRQGREGSKQRAVNFDWDVVDRVFPAAKDSDQVDMDLRYETDKGILTKRHWLKRQDKNWRLEGNCPSDRCYHFVAPGSLFAMQVDSGRSPATGSWAVFPEDHAVTRAILADGESSRLTGSAMIALHDEEGVRTWRVLSTARPDIFDSHVEEGVGSTEKDEKMGQRGKELPPNPARLVDILAAVGHTLPSAVSDIVDNAISADATAVDIVFGRPDSGHGRWLTITDNGRGMTESVLAEAMRIGSDSTYKQNDLGKYGYGLKGASWSQANVFTVVSKCESGNRHHLTWDREDMDKWIAKSDPLEPWEEAATTLGPHGTAVLWKDMRPPLAQTTPGARGLDPYTLEVTHLERHLALVFHRFIGGKATGRQQVTISINGSPVKPNNPVGHPLVISHDLPPLKVPLETGYGSVQVRAFVLPSEAELTAYHRDMGQAATREAFDAIGLYGKRNETQGLFIYRNDRLIKWGGWHQMWETNDEKTKLARVVVNFDQTLDDAFKINISKQIVQLPQHLQAEIRKIAEIVRKESQKKYRKDVQASAAAGLAAPSGSKKRPPTSPVGPIGVGGTGNGGNTLQPAQAVSLRPVKTGKFLWKISKGLTGNRDLQVSELDPNLTALVRLIEDDVAAVAHLSGFLESLDELDVQGKLLAKRKD